MDLRRLIGVNVATLAVLSALMVGMGKNSPVLPLVTACAAAAAIWLTDVKRWFSLSPAAVNTIVVLIAAVTIWKFVLSRRAIDPLMFADAFVYLQILLLFEKKTLRTWWDLLCLSLVLVLLSAQSRAGPLFGLALVVYLFFGLSALALMLLYRERAVRVSTGGEGGRWRRGENPARETGVEWQRLGKIAMVTLVVGPLSLFIRFREPAPEAGKPRPVGPRGAFSRWPWLGQTLTAVGSPAGPADRAATGRAFWGQVTMMTVACLAVSTVVFCAVPRGGRVDFRFPRFGRSVSESAEGGVRRSVGFSDSVELGELGTIIEDTKQVLDVRLTHYASHQRYPVRGNVYLRGAVLNRYQAGEWKYQPAGGRLHVARVGVDVPSDTEGLVRQRILIEPMDRREVFCIWPFVAASSTMGVSFYRENERLYRPQELHRSKFSFQLATTAFVDGEQADLAPCGKRVAVEPLLQWPAQSLPGLAALADQWVAESGIPAHDPAGRARLLESRLGQSGQFLYSLEGKERDPELDPIEDFVTNNRQGHCEYFATALTLMLRSQGIPARMVVGYKCDEYSYASDAYRVRQSHAHAWVEAYLPPDKLPADVRSRPGFSDPSHGAWLRLDATPRASAGVAMVDLVAHGFEDWLEWFRSVWRNEVLGMDSIRQREVIYGPLAEQFVETTSRLVSLHWWRDTLAGLFRAFVTPPGGPAATARLFSIAGLLLVAAAGLWWARRRFPAMAGKLMPRRTRAARSHRPNDRPDVGFYRRLETLLARFDLTRRASQTQREFARHAGQTLARLTGQAQVVGLPPEVAEAFYQVRFGGDDLDGPQADAVAKALRQLEQAVDGDGKP